MPGIGRMNVQKLIIIYGHTDFIFMRTMYLMGHRTGQKCLVVLYVQFVHNTDSFYSDTEKTYLGLNK